MERGRRKGKGMREGEGEESCQRVATDGGGAEDWDPQEKRTVYTLAECTATTTAWVSVVDDPVQGNMQNVKGLWSRIQDKYEIFKPEGAKFHNGAELRKTWERKTSVVSRFTGIYENKTHSMTSGQTMYDVKELSLQQYPEGGRYPRFKYWDAFLVLKNFAKF